MSLDPITVTKLWLLVKPYKRFKAWRARRKGLPMAIDLGTRTSTNTVVGSPILGVVYVNLVQMLPYPEAVVLTTAGFAWLVARFSKTYEQPKP
jgi:hypothetical protein